MVIDSKIKILNLSTCDYGGAGSATVVFNNFLNALGYDSTLMVRDSQGEKPKVVTYNRRGTSYLTYKIKKIKFRKDLANWNRLCRKKEFVNNIVFDDQKTFSTAQIIIKQLGFIPDLILLHWTHNFITPEIVADLKKITNAKIVSVMMDNAIITGGCHYPFDCLGYTNGCKKCPLFKLETSFPAEILSRKIDNYPGDMEFWGTTTDCERAKKSLLGKSRGVYPILFPIDETIFPQKSKEVLRKEYGIGSDRLLLLVGCTTFAAGDNRKGFEYLLSILLLIKERAPELQKNISIVVVGDNKEGILDKLGYDMIKLGFLPMAKLMEVYKMSDLFISTSVEDSGPLMVNQSIAIGTPVASFNIGVAEDLVEDGETGLKADLYDFNTLANKIIEYLSLKRDYSSACVEIYKKKREIMSPKLQIERILKVKE